MHGDTRWAVNLVDMVKDVAPRVVVDIAEKKEGSAKRHFEGVGIEVIVN